MTKKELIIRALSECNDRALIAASTGATERYVWHIARILGKRFPKRRRHGNLGVVRRGWGGKFPCYRVGVEILRAANLDGCTTLTYRASPGRLILEAHHA